LSRHGRDNPTGHPDRGDNRAANLELGFEKDNMQDMVRDRAIREQQRLAKQKQ